MLKVSAIKDGYGWWEVCIKKNKYFYNASVYTKVQAEKEALLDYAEYLKVKEV